MILYDELWPPPFFLFESIRGPFFRWTSRFFIVRSHLNSKQWSWANAIGRTTFRKLTVVKILFDALDLMVAFSNTISRITRHSNGTYPWRDKTYFYEAARPRQRNVNVKHKVKELSIPRVWRKFNLRTRSIPACLNMSRTREEDHPAVKGKNKLQRELTTGKL